MQSNILYDSCFVCQFLKNRYLPEAKHSEFKKLTELASEPCPANKNDGLYVMINIHKFIKYFNKRTNGPVNAHLISEPSISINHTKPDLND